MSFIKNSIINSQTGTTTKSALNVFYTSVE